MHNVYSLQEIFAGKVLQVPDYQRGYSWDDQQLKELVEDLELLAANKNHYTGTLVLHKQHTTVRDDGGQKYELYHVVDGQQRLTTTVILLDAIRAHMSKIKPAMATGIERSYIRFTDANGQPAFKLRLNSDCQDYFVHNVLGKTPGPQGPEIASHERLSEAREYFAGILSASAKRLGTGFSQWLQELHDKVTQRLRVTQYFVDDATDVGVIFEVMNNRGKPLSELEKVKNYLLYAASKLDVAEHDLDQEINAAWTEIFRRLMTARLTAAEFEDRLLRAHWLVAYDPARKNWHGSKTVKSHFDLRSYHKKHKALLKGLREYVRSLQDSVLAFAEIFAPWQTGSFSAYAKGEQAELRHWATKLPRTGVLSPFLPILIAVRLRFPNDAAIYLEALKLFETFAFRVYRWEGRRADAGQTRLFRLGFDLYHKNTTLEEISKEVRQLGLAYCSDRTFQDGFEPADDNNFYLWPGIRYFLYEYEEHLSKGRGVKMSWEQLQKLDPQKTIEHVLPQHPNNKYWKDRFDAAQRRKLANHIGNLTLTFDNSVYSNKAYPEKRGDLKAANPCYATSNLFGERQIAKEFEDWNEDAILNRGKHLRKWALERWRIDSVGLAAVSTDELLQDEEQPEME